ncbi:MAG: class I SAM-dependent methyltransferase [Peptoniphilaceae bacterium]|nr:class I SAM-dependent methyltransferase [Peptoniphilaceae bacterium]MDY6019191.1 class I SAM-dependent methyltransferase [Anaerococcus sp.]
MIDNTKELVRKILIEEGKRNGYVLDMTCGKGYDSKFILENLSPKKLYAFDIQELSKEFTEKTLGSFKENFVFILDNHKNLDLYVKEEIDLAIFNLGYLPSSDKTITTNYKDVIEALEKILKKLTKNSMIIITFYPGHPSGKEEYIYVGKYLKNLSQQQYSIIKYDFINQKNDPPLVVKIIKK